MFYMIIGISVLPGDFGICVMYFVFSALVSLTNRLADLWSIILPHLLDGIVPRLLLIIKRIHANAHFMNCISAKGDGGVTLWRKI